jgi:hypothetical protein
MHHLSGWIPLLSLLFIVIVVLAKRKKEDKP